MFTKSFVLSLAEFKTGSKFLLFSLFFSLFSLYIPQLELTISLRSLLFLMSGVVLGPVFGSFNAAFCDFLSVLIKGHYFSPLFFVQSIFFGFIGGIWGSFFKKTENYFWNKNALLISISAFLFFIVPVVLSFFNSLLLIPIFLFAIFLGVMYFSLEKRLSKKNFYLLCNLIFLLLISSFVGSFLLGSWAVLIFNPKISILLSLNFRVLKEIFKISISIIPLFLVLKRYV